MKTESEYEESDVYYPPQHSTARPAHRDSISTNWCKHFLHVSPLPATQPAIFNTISLHAFSW